MKKLAIVISFDSPQSIPHILSDLSEEILREIRTQSRPGWDFMKLNCIGDLDSGHGFDYQFFESDQSPALAEIMDWAESRKK